MGKENNSLNSLDSQEFKIYQNRYKEAKFNSKLVNSQKLHHSKIQDQIMKNKE